MTTAARHDGQRRQRRKEERPDEILKAALHEFAANGFAATKVDDVARRAGISKGTVYLYFDSKQRLFEAVVRHWILPPLERIETLAQADEISSASLIRHQIATLYTELVGTDLRHILRLMIAEGPRFPDLVEFYYHEIVKRGLAAITRVIDRGIATGEFRPTAARDAPQAVIGAAIMAATWRLLFEERHPVDLAALMKGHCDVVLNGLLRR